MAPGVVLYFVACIAAGWFGRNRRIGFLGFFLASILFTPLLTLLVLLLSSPKPDPAVVAARAREAERQRMAKSST